MPYDHILWKSLEDNAYKKNPHTQDELDDHIHITDNL